MSLLGPASPPISPTTKIGRAFRICRNVLIAKGLERGVFHRAIWRAIAKFISPNSLRAMSSSIFKGHAHSGDMLQTAQRTNERNWKILLHSGDARKMGRLVAIRRACRKTTYASLFAKMLPKPSFSFPARKGHHSRSQRTGPKRLLARPRAQLLQNALRQFCFPPEHRAQNSMAGFAKKTALRCVWKIWTIRRPRPDERKIRTSEKPDSRVFRLPRKYLQKALVKTGRNHGVFGTAWEVGRSGAAGRVVGPRFGSAGFRLSCNWIYRPMANRVATGDFLRDVTQTASKVSANCSRMPVNWKSAWRRARANFSNRKSVYRALFFCRSSARSRHLSLINDVAAFARWIIPFQKNFLQCAHGLPFKNHFPRLRT